MIGSIVWTFAVLWPIQLALYWIAMKILRANFLHALWFATLTAYVTAAALNEQALLEAGVAKWLLYAPLVLCTVLGGIVFTSLFYWRNNSIPDPHWHDYIPDTTFWRWVVLPSMMAAHVPGTNQVFMLAFNIVGGIMWIRARSKRSAEHQRPSTEGGAA